MNNARERLEAQLPHPNADSVTPRVSVRTADLRTVLDALSKLEAKESAREDQGRRALEYYYETTCPCTAAERYVPTCPKHGTPLLERGRK